MTSSDKTPTVTLGGIEYSVPPIAFREVSEILPLVGMVFQGLRSELLSKAALEGLGRLVFFGITAGQRELKYDEFISRPATAEEMTAAALVVCRQAGLKMKDPSPGEAKGT